MSLENHHHTEKKDQKQKENLKTDSTTCVNKKTTGLK